MLLPPYLPMAELSQPEAMVDAAGEGWNAVAADSADPAQAVLFLMLPQAVALRGVVVR